jgi:uncharacterized protein (TIGR01244 family)
MFTRLDDTILVYGQLDPADVAQAKALGVTMIVNNRPDDEQPGQPSGAEIEAAARAAGIAYRAIPVTHAGFSLPQVDAMVAALDGAGGTVLAFCRSGTRSTLLWALAQAKSGADLSEVAAKARAAGYDVSPVRPAMDALAAG